MQKKYLLAIDQGTTNSRAIVFSAEGEPISYHQLDLTRCYPQLGWVEQDPEEMVNHTIICCQIALEKSKLHARDIAAIGITNQRETTIIWDKITGKSIYPAIVWQDRRTSELCKNLSKGSFALSIEKKTGLILDPYFSATKICWILDNIPNAKIRAQRGELLFGTIDSFLLWHLTKGKIHATDATNASRTLLFNIHTQKWDEELLGFFDIPPNMLPKVLDSSAEFGLTDSKLFGQSIPITSVIGDQQAATVGQACFKPGMLKATYGTGCFVALNTGDKVIQSKNKLLSTIAYRLNGKVTYALEGSIFSAGTTVKWFRDKLKFIQSASETETLCLSVPDTGGVYLVPAFSGLGAPYWNPDARGLLTGLTQASTIAEIVRAGMEAVGYQTRDLLEAMQKDSHIGMDGIRIDGGMTANCWLSQFIADILQKEIHCPKYPETTALGAAYLAGLQIGIFTSLEDIANRWQAKQVFYPKINLQKQKLLYNGWLSAVAMVCP
jgi:glycerol kinase